MAVSFDGVDDYLSNAAALATGAPFSIAGWCFKTTATAPGVIFSIGSATTSAQFSMVYNASEDMTAGATSVLEGSDTAITSGAGANNAWTHGAAVYETTTSRWAYRDGGNAVQNTFLNVPLLLDRTRIGKRANSDDNDQFPGYLADIGLWNIALSAGDVAALAKGVSPLHVHPESLVGYWPLSGRHNPEVDRVGGAQMTYNSAPAFVSNHPKLRKVYRKLGQHFIQAAVTTQVTADAVAVGVAALSAQIGKIAAATAVAVSATNFRVGATFAAVATGTSTTTMQIGKIASATATGVADVVVLFIAAVAEAVRARLAGARAFIGSLMTR